MSSHEEKLKRKEKLQENDEQQQQKFDGALLKRALGFCKPFIKDFILAFFLLCCVAGCNLIIPYITKRIIDDGIETKDMHVITMWSIIFIVSLFVRHLAAYFQITAFSKTAQKITKNIRVTLFEHIQNMSYSFFNTHETGRLISRIMGDVDALNALIVRGILTLFVDICTAIGVFFIMLRMNTSLTLWILAFVPILAIVSYIFKRKTRESYRDVRKKQASVTGAVSENVTGIRVIKSFAREKANLNHYRRVSRSLRKSLMRSSVFGLIFSLSLEALTFLSAAVIFVVGGIMIKNNALTLGGFAAFIQYIDSFFNPIRNISNFYDMLQQAMAGAERIFTILDTESEIKDAENAVCLGRVKGEVEFKNVHFRYTENKPILKNVSFRTEPGKTIAFVGPTGAGKSTIITILARQYDVNQGSITVDGYNIKDVTQKSLRSNIGVVLQDSYLFMDTIMENIRFGKPDATDEEVIQAAKTVGIYDFIMSLPKGFQTEIKDGSSNLSTGQKQLLSFARALIADPAILVLDEATSSVDTNTEKLIQHALKQLFRNRTSFVVAHRLSTISEADCIYVIEDGEIKESGTHEELMQIENGKYHRLYEIQFAKLKENQQN